jgi:LysR family cyn operon transcriptional activator
VRIASPAMVTQYVLGRPMVDFLAAHPGIHLRQLQAGARQIEELVLRNEVDFGITAEREFAGELESTVLCELDNVACVGADSPLAKGERMAWKDLLQQPLALFPVGFHQRSIVDQHAERLKLRPRIAVEAESPAVLLQAVRAGLAATTLPAPAAAGAPGVTSIRLQHQAGDRLLVAACWRKAAPMSKAAQALLVFLERELGHGVRRPRRG